MMDQVIVLNADYSFLNIVSLERAFLYIAKGKVQVEKYSENFISTYDTLFKVPLVVRFTKMIRQIYKRKVPWSKKNVMLRDKFTCQYCGEKQHRMTIDHVVPKSRGGKNIFENTVCACFQCNNIKDDRTPQEANMFLKVKPVQPTISEFLRMVSQRRNITDLIDGLFK